MSCAVDDCIESNLERKNPDLVLTKSSSAFVTPKTNWYVPCDFETVDFEDSIGSHKTLNWKGTPKRLWETMEIFYTRLIIDCLRMNSSQACPRTHETLHCHPHFPEP